MPKIFVSYRREDSAAVTGRLCDRLREKFGAKNIFVDIDDIPFGEDFLVHIQSTLKGCDAVVAVVGRRWRGRRRNGRYRLFEENDFVRMELSMAISDSISLLPILVDDAKMPLAEELPNDLQRLARINAAPLDVGRDFTRHAEKIITVLGDMVGRVGFEVTFAGGTGDIWYECRNCGYGAGMEKPEWFRDGDRPPSKCPKCGKKGYEA